MSRFPCQLFCFILCCMLSISAVGQTASISGQVSYANTFVAFATVKLIPGPQSVVSDSAGAFSFTNLKPGTYNLRVSRIGFTEMNQVVKLRPEDSLNLHVEMLAAEGNMNEVVVTGTLKEVRRME